MSMNLFWGFCVFYGLTFAVGVESKNSDINRYHEHLMDLYEQPELSINDVISNFKDSKEIDVFNMGITYGISRFTDNRGILTMFYAVFLGFFLSRNIWYILNLLKGRISFLEKIILLALFLLIPIWFINGVRMWTAFHVFFYGLLPYIFENRKNRLRFVFLSIFVHFSFIVPISAFFIYFFARNRLKPYFVVFIFSIFFSNLNMGIFNDYIDRFAPQSIAERSASYRNEDVISARNQASQGKALNWYVKWQYKALDSSLYILIIYLFLFGNPLIKNDPIWKRLISFMLIFMIYGNFLAHIPSGARFINFGRFTGLFFILLYLNQFRNDFYTKRMTTVFLPAFLLFIIVSIRMGLYYTSITTIAGNPILALFNAGETISINDVIK